MILKYCLEISDRVIVLHSGKLICDGKPEDVRNNPEVKEIYMGKEVVIHA